MCTLMSDFNYVDNKLKPENSIPHKIFGGINTNRQFFILTFRKVKSANIFLYL
jgi:hypothetical protein